MHLKKLILIISILAITSVLIFTEAIAQNYTVIAVKGAIKSKKMGKNIRPGDELALDDNLTFKTKTDFVSLISAENQRKYIAYPLKKFKRKKAVYNMQFLLKDATPGFIPVMPYLGSVEDAKVYFTSRPFLLFGPDSKIKVNKKAFPMSRALFFYVNYDYKDDNVDKKLDYKADTLIFIKRNIFKIDGKEVDSKYADRFRLYYYNQPKTKITSIGKWSPIFIVDERLKEETDILYNKLKSVNVEDSILVKEFTGFLYDHYGNMIATDLQDWMAEQYPSVKFPAIRQTPAPAAVPLAAEKKKKPAKKSNKIKKVKLGQKK